MAKSSKQIIIDAIIGEIEKGTDRGKVVAKYCKKFQKSARTVDTYWKIANEQHSIKQEAIKKELAVIDTNAAIDARKKAIMTADERKEYLTKIINGQIRFVKPFVIAGKIMEYKSEPDANERLKAISELNKMEGDYAPQKIAQTNISGQDIAVSALSPADLKTLLDLKQKIAK